MAKSNKKTPKEASNLFHNIMKASMKSTEQNIPQTLENFLFRASDSEFEKEMAKRKFSDEKSLKIVNDMNEKKNGYVYWLEDGIIKRKSEKKK